MVMVNNEVMHNKVVCVKSACTRQPSSESSACSARHLRSGHTGLHLPVPPSAEDHRLADQDSYSFYAYGLALLHLHIQKSKRAANCLVFAYSHEPAVITFVMHEQECSLDRSL